MFQKIKKTHTSLLPAILLFLFVAAPSVALAQALEQSVQFGNISIYTTPKNVGPNQNFSVFIESSSFNTRSAEITWIVDGKKYGPTAGLNSLNLKSKGAGQATNISVSTDSSQYGVITKSITIVPASIDIISSTLSYTPPFYFGRALPASQAIISLWAIPQIINSSGKTVSSKDVYFTWKIDGEIQGNASGTGRDTFSYKDGRLPEDTKIIEVEASYAREGITSSALFRATQIQPKINLYEISPTLGVIPRAIMDRMYLNKQEMSLVAYPFYFSTRNRESSTFIPSWTINGSSVSDTGLSKTILTLRQPGGAGSSRVGFYMESDSFLFQNADKTVTIEYGQ